MMNNTFTKDDLLALAYFERDSYVKDLGLRGWDCLIDCIGDPIETLKDLQDHGIADGLTEEECWERLKQNRERESH